MAGLQRKKQASNPILWKFSRVKKLYGRFFCALLSKNISFPCIFQKFFVPLHPQRFEYLKPSLADVKQQGHINSITIIHIQEKSPENWFLLNWVNAFHGIRKRYSATNKVMFTLSVWAYLVCRRVSFRTSRECERKARTFFVPNLRLIVMRN